MALDLIVSSSARPVLRRLKKLFLCWFAIFLTILLVRWEIVDSPPYYDFAVGIWTEAEFLARTGFDYRALRDGPHVLDEHSGPRSYLVTIVPTFLAVLMRLFPVHGVPLVLYHVTVFGFAAIVAIQVHSLARHTCGPLTSKLLALMVVTTPIFAVQIDMTGMEIFLAAAMLACAVCLARGQLLLSVVPAALTFAIKATGLIITIAAATAIALGLVVSWSNRERTGLREGIVALGAYAVLIGLQIAITSWGSSFAPQVGAGIPLTMALIWCPDVVTVLFAGILGAAWYWRGVVSSERGPRRLIRLCQRAGEAALHARHVTFAVLVIAGLLAATTLTVPFLPRYVTALVPLVAILFCEGFGHVVRRGTFGVVLCVIVAVNLMNWNGAFLPDMVRGARWVSQMPMLAFSRSGSFIERSHEYLPEHRANMEAARILERDFKGQPIVCPIPFAFFLTFPEMCYVKHALPVYSVNGIRDLRPTAWEASDLIRDQPRRAVFVQNLNFYNLIRPRWQIPWPDAHDALLFEDCGQYPMALFQKSWPADAAPEIIDRWYRHWLHFDEQLATILFYRLGIGDWEGAVAALRDRLSNDPHSQSSRVILAALLAYRGQKDEARTVLSNDQREDSVVSRPYPAPGGSSCMDAFIGRLEARTRSFSEDPAGRFQAAMSCFEAVQLDRGAECCRELLLAIDPGVGDLLP